ncbi:hypothetical protein C0583_02085 [Candidatus Parcubacteria bacterium]|nr:MAG: hypothetical protein C0583_02085 [Candidatus Parcubacteria bacterium]
MKIAQIVCSYPPYKGGIGNVAKQYTKTLEERGHKVTIFTPFFNNKKTKDDVREIKSFLQFGNAAVLYRLLNSLNNFDIVYLHYPFFGTDLILYLDKIINKNKYKLLVHYHMDTSSLPGIKKFLAVPSNLIKKCLFNKSTKISCASLDYIENSDIKKYYKNNKNKFFVVPFSVDTELFKPDQEKKEKELINITFVGGMDKAHYFKGVDNLIEVFSEINDKKIKLNLVGYGELQASYKKQVKNLGIEKKVNFYGKLELDKLVQIYQKSDIFVLPSINSHEAFGIVQIEAMSCGVPVISSDLPGVRSVYEDGVQGFNIKTGDKKDLKEKLNKLITDYSLRKKMSDSARMLAKNKYDKKIIDSKFSDFIEKI